MEIRTCEEYVLDELGRQTAIAEDRIEIIEELNKKIDYLTSENDKLYCCIDAIMKAMTKGNKFSIQESWNGNHYLYIPSFSVYEKDDATDEPNATYDLLLGLLVHYTKEEPNDKIPDEAEEE